MSNSSTKKAKRRAKLEEDDVIYLNGVSPLKVKNISFDKEKKVEKKQEKKKIIPQDEVLSTTKVKCNCNKCSTPVEGSLIGVLFSPIPNVSIPFISYTCSFCKHIGKRSVFSKALPPDEFEKVYF